MAKFGSTTGKKLGSDAGRQRIKERRARMAEARNDTSNPKASRSTSESGDGESGETKRTPKRS